MKKKQFLMNSACQVFDYKNEITIIFEYFGVKVYLIIRVYVLYNNGGNHDTKKLRLNKNKQK